MNKEWSALNKMFQSQIGKEDTFFRGIETLLTLRNLLMNELLRMKECSRDDFNKMPFPNVNGYHSKTIAYSIWHIFRIEDIVLHSLILSEDEIFVHFQDKINSPIITTGNELAGEQIADFSKSLDLESLYAYAKNVKECSDYFLKQLFYKDLHQKFTDEDKKRLQELKVVSTDESASWLIDYWCGKDICGLLKMPFSRHWIMHIEASLRIEGKIRK